MSAAELQAISQKSCGVLKGLGPQIQWVQSYVTGDKVCCVYIAPDEAMADQESRWCRGWVLATEREILKWVIAEAEGF